MTIVTATQLSQSFGPVDIFSNIAVSVPNDAKIGLVGPNGVGKTTLLLMLAGMTQPLRGTIQWAKGKRLGYLPQESAQAFGDQNHTVYQEMLAVFSDLRSMEVKLRQMEIEMGETDAPDDLIERYGVALDQFELAGGYKYELRIKQVLQGLGFSDDDWGLQLNHLSGGQKTRALLARLLLEKPDLLILDEPTNHLDIQAVEWLEGMLRTWDGAILLVSHDRYFLDRVVNTIWEMSSERVEVYRGNYTAYIHQRHERWQQRQQVFEKRREHLERELEYVRRNIAGQRSQMAKGKLSRISRELDAIQRAGMEGTQGKNWAEITSELGGAARRTMSIAEATEAIRRLKAPDPRHRTFKVTLKKSQRSGKIILRTKDLVIGYPSKSLFSSADIELHRLETAALIGPNGSGKTTFLRTILGEQPPLEGDIHLGASLDIGYFAQAHEQLDPNLQVIDELMRQDNMLLAEARKYLARYLFHGDDVFKPIATLSGGERGRLALALLALTGANFLLLDEPTNHLDIPAQEMLQDVLEQFEGTILLVTHDRYLVDRLATQLWLLEDGQLNIFEGSYQEYLQAREQAESKEKEQTENKRLVNRQRVRQARAYENAARKKAERLQHLEQEIARLEEKLELLAADLQVATGEDAFDKIQNLSIEYTTVEKQLTDHLDEWEKLARESSMA